MLVPVFAAKPLTSAAVKPLKLLIYKATKIHFDPELCYLIEEAIEAAPALYCYVRAYLISKQSY